MPHRGWFCLVLLQTVLVATARLQGVDRAPHSIGWLIRPDARLEYLEFGDRRRPPIVLLPGYGDNAHIFDDLAPLLAPKYRVVALTPRGHGASSTPNTGYTVRAFADDLE